MAFEPGVSPQQYIERLKKLSASILPTGRTRLAHHPPPNAISLPRDPVLHDPPHQPSCRPSARTLVAPCRPQRPRHSTRPSSPPQSLDHPPPPGAGTPLGLAPHDPPAADDLVPSELVAPADRQVDLRLHAQDVIHGFSIPEMRLKQNAVPGQTIHLHFTPTTPGTYAILCTQLCGLGHFRMNATLRVLPPEQFATWLATKEKAAQP